MKLVRVGAAVLNQTPLDWNGNRDRILDAISQARDARVSILCFPELCITGYGCEDAFQSPGLWRTAFEVLQEIVPATRGLVVSVGLPLVHRNSLFNTAAMLVDGEIVGFVAKRFLAGEGLYYEPRWFKPWPEAAAGEAEFGDLRFPMGDLYFEIGGIRIGFEICEDAWVANRRGGDLADRGIDLILNPSASHFAFGKHAVRERFVLEGSRSFGVTYVYSNLLGNESGRMIYDGGALIATEGEMVAAGPRFGFREVYLTFADVDIDATRMSQARLGSRRPNVADDPLCIERRFPFPEVDPQVRPSAPGASTEPEEDDGGIRVERAAWERSDPLAYEEFSRAVSLALFDYMRKSRSHGFVISFSGGADSAAVACLVRQMVGFALAELGNEELHRRLAYWHLSAETEEQWLREILTCVYQSTRNSSETTRNAARVVASALSATYHELDVDSLVEQYREIVETALQRKLSWERDDLALQNIQARVRAPGVWMIANLEGALLLATSNRSEAAVGYATMDGDTCGGLSPIAGIDKAFLRRWLRWLERIGPEGLGAIPELSLINQQNPTAELRPPEHSQTDEADLMPYDLLDAIEDAAIGDKKTPLEVFRHVSARFPRYERAQLVEWVDRFFRLWCRNQWKRERYAPSFHVDDKNLDPKTWCRFPILSGGFERELAELRRREGERG